MLSFCNYYAHQQKMKKRMKSFSAIVNAAEDSAVRGGIRIQEYPSTSVYCFVFQVVLLPTLLLC